MRAMSVHVRQVQAMGGLGEGFQQLPERGRRRKEPVILKDEVTILGKATSPGRMGLVRCNDVDTTLAQEFCRSRDDFTRVRRIRKAVHNRSDAQSSKTRIALHPGVHHEGPADDLP